jgi:hypothetical protein
MILCIRVQHLKVREQMIMRAHACLSVCGDIRFLISIEPVCREAVRRQRESTCQSAVSGRLTGLRHRRPRFWVHRVRGSLFGTVCPNPLLHTIHD